tara:strand:+ start:84 stop:464 length:381 start_codon:yes stop_codon:yes gene_type:complete
MLKYTNTRTVNLGEFNNLVEETYGRPYNFQQQDGCKSRGTAHFSVPIEGGYDYKATEIPVEVNGDVMGVSFASWLARDPDENVLGKAYRNSMFWERNFYPDLDMVVQDLYEKGLIEAGDYTIEIDW